MPRGPSRRTLVLGLSNWLIPASKIRPEYVVMHDHGPPVGGPRNLERDVIQSSHHCVRPTAQKTQYPRTPFGHFWPKQPHGIPHQVAGTPRPVVVIPFPLSGTLPGRPAREPVDLLLRFTELLHVRRSILRRLVRRRGPIHNVHGYIDLSDVGNNHGSNTRDSSQWCNIRQTLVARALLGSL